MDQSKLLKKLIGILIVVLLMLFAAIYFVYGDIKSKNEKILQVEHSVNLKSTQYDYLISMQKFIENTKPEIEKINSSIVSSNGDVDFIENLEARARSHNLKIEIESLTLVSSDTKNSSSSISTLKIKAKADGLWSNVYTFISEIESLPYKIKINKFSLSSNANLINSLENTTDESKNWRANFEISVLKYK